MSALRRLRRGTAALAAGVGTGLLAIWLLTAALAIYSIAILASTLLGWEDDR